LIPHVTRYADSAAFVAAAAPWLLRTEAEHNLLLGVLDRLRHGEPGAGGRPYMAAVEVDGALAGCAVRTPPHKLLITRMPTAAVPVLAADVAGCFTSLPAVLGPEAVAREFGRWWSQRHGCTATDGMRQRLYVLRELHQPARAAPGFMAEAGPADQPLVLSWIRAFAGEAGVQGVDATRHAVGRIAAGDVVLWWNDGAVCCMAAVAGRSPTGSRIGYVYTPPALRGRGYATSCVTELTRRELSLGAGFCCLFSDVANRTSNSIYQQVGYQPVCDFLDIEFSGGTW
jgi:uncharacterized protein